MATFNAKTITSNANGISLVQVRDAKNTFCEVWPGAKKALDSYRV